MKYHALCNDYLVCIHNTLTDEPHQSAGLNADTVRHICDRHRVILRDILSAAEAQILGPLIETHSRFPQRTNVQFARVLDRHHLQLEIWERGAGYTLASGSSSCAAAAVAVRLGLCEPALTVSMPGGDLQIVLLPDHHAQMTGPAVRVATIELDDEALVAA